MPIKKHIPNLFTLSNLLCGLLGIIIVMRAPFTIDSAYLVGTFMVVAMLFDFIDGFAARALNVASPLGLQLDSLADMVTFGALPSFLLYSMIEAETSNSYLPILGLSVALFSAFRLAKFNIDERQVSGFYGLPTPANAFLILSVYLIYVFDIQNTGGLWSGIIGEYIDLEGLSSVFSAYVLGGFSLFSSWLLISDIPMLALKFKSSGWHENKYRYSLMVTSVVLFVLLFYKAIPLILALYFVFSWIERRK